MPGLAGRCGLRVASRESVRAKLRPMVKRILRKYKYPPDQQEAAIELMLQQAKALSDAWIQSGSGSTGPARKRPATTVSAERQPECKRTATSTLTRGPPQSQTG